MNSSLLSGRRSQTIAKIDANIFTPALTALMRASAREQVQKQESLAHITQAEGEAMKEFDAAVGRIEDFLRKNLKEGGSEKDQPPPVKTQRIIKAADIMKKTYLESSDDVNGFLDALRQELEKAISNNERIQIR